MMQVAPLGRPGLSDLARVELPPDQEAGLARLHAASLGPAVWRARKREEARELLALACIAPRMTVLALDATTDLRGIVRLRATAPCLPPGAADLVVEHEVHLGLFYPQEILRRPLPGTALVRILAPRDVFHPNVGRPGSGPAPPLCLGANVPRGFPLREAVLASYAALTLQSVTLDERDPAGVLNPDAALWWRAAAHRIPLCAAPFLADPQDPAGGLF